MEMLGMGDYLCESCKHFGECAKQGLSSMALFLGQKCPYGYDNKNGEPKEGDELC